MSPVPVRLPAPAPARQRRPAPGPAPERLRPGTARPRLRLVDNRRLELAARRRRARRLGVVGAALAVAALLALAGTHAMLVSNQVRLDALEQQVAEAQAHHQDLRLEVATLEDPARVVSVATDLGLVPPEVVTYLQPVVPAHEQQPVAPGAPEIASGALPGQADKPPSGTP